MEQPDLQGCWEIENAGQRCYLALSVAAGGSSVHRLQCFVWPLALATVCYSISGVSLPDPQVNQLVKVPNQLVKELV